MKRYLIILFISLFSLGCSKTENKSHIKLNLLNSSSTPQLLFPEFFPSDLHVQNFVFDENQKAFYYTIADPYFSYNNIICADNKSIKIAPFSGKYSDIDPFITTNGEKIFFVSNRPTDGSGTPKNDYDIWYANNINDQWDEPIRLDSNINSSANEYYVSLSIKENLYFSSTRNGGIGSWDVYYSNLKTKQLNLLPEPVNTEYREWDPFIAPDESYIIFTSDRPNGFGGGDLYISFKSEEGYWENPINLGNEINTTGYEFCPFVSPDGKFLFYSRFGNANLYPNSKYTYNNFIDNLRSCKNGLGKIYYIDFKILKSKIARSK